MTKCNRRSNILHLSNQLPTVDDVEEAPCRLMANDNMPTLIIIIIIMNIYEAHKSKKVLLALYM